MSLIKCHECGKEVSDEAGQCPHCGAKPKKKTSLLTWIIALFVGYVIFRTVLVSNSTPTTPASLTPSPSNTTQTAPAKPTWNYDSNKDEVSGKDGKSAMLQSINSHNLDFPYQGGTRGMLIVRKHPRHGKDVIFNITKGQLLCGVQDCLVSVKFDDKPPIKVTASAPADHSHETLFLSGFDRLVKGFKESKTTIIEVTFYQQGSKTFEFPTEGLKWD